MRGRVTRLVDALASNLWLVPVAAFALAFALSRGLVIFDRRVDVSTQAWFVYGGSPSGAQQLMSTIAGSMITFIGLVFSSTILTLQLASSQFSPRVMRSFFSDRIIQLSLGVFIATFAFAIFVLREIRDDPSHPFVPGLSTFAAISLVWFSLAMFVTYINHIGQRIRAISVVETAAKETMRELRRLRELRPDPYPYDPPRSGDAKLVRVRNYGVLGSIDGPALAKLAAEHDAVYEIVPQPGDFLRGDAPLVRVWLTGTIDEKHASAIHAKISIGRERTIREDVLFGFRQLVDIADKALSPGINDPTTAVEVIDQLHELLHDVANEPLRSDVYRDANGAPRVYVPQPAWANFVDSALEEVLLYGRGSIHVLRRLRELLIDLTDSVRDVDRPKLESFLARVETCIDAAFDDPADRAAARRLPRTVV